MDKIMKKNMVRNLVFFLSVVIAVTASVCRAAEISPVQGPSLQSSSFTIAQENYLQRVLSPQQREELASMGRVLARNPSYTLIQNKWVEFISHFDSGGEPIDIAALSQYVLRDSYFKTNKDLEPYAEKVRYFNESKKKLREELAKARQQRSQPSIIAQPAERRSNAGEPQEVYPPPTDVEIRRIEAQLDAVGNDEQLAKLKLQNQMTKHQQALGTLSNVAKQMYDAAISIIKKIG